jgi:3-deoxy-D-arabino-heptulosonate 7-phosphate (DAHP) synthase class II
MRESMIRLADASSNPAAATAAAKTYFTDINDINEWSRKKSPEKVAKYYEQSVADLNAFKALI